MWRLSKESQLFSPKRRQLTSTFPKAHFSAHCPMYSALSFRCYFSYYPVRSSRERARISFVLRNIHLQIRKTQYLELASTLSGSKYERFCLLRSLGFSSYSPPNHGLRFYSKGILLPGRRNFRRKRVGRQRACWRVEV